jgi:hypothetical protein
MAETSDERDLRSRLNADRRRRFGDTERPLALLCECDDPSCRETVVLSVDEYDSQRPAAAIVHPSHAPAER